MSWKCPFCGSTHDGDSPLDAAAEVSDALAHGDGPSPSTLYAQMGGGDAYRRAMVRHGYVIVQADVRCGVVKGACSCLLKKGHDGSHLCPHGDWT